MPTYKVVLIKYATLFVDAADEDDAANSALEKSATVVYTEPQVDFIDEISTRKVTN